MVSLFTTVWARGQPKLKLRYRLPSGDSKRKSSSGSPYPITKVAFQPPNKGYRGSISSSDCLESVESAHKMMKTAVHKNNTKYHFFPNLQYSHLSFYQNITIVPL